MMIVLAMLASLPMFVASGPYGVVYTFQAGSDGFEPKAGLIADTAGNLYGTTFNGGGKAGAGTVYQLQPPASPGGAWTEVVLHRFSYHDLLDGWSPWGGLAGDKAGNIYGTAWLGGTCGICGIVFELSPPNKIGGSWRYAVIHNFFDNGIDGINPQTDLTIDAAGNLYGTTASGGKGACYGGCGVVFELAPSGHGAWNELILHNFPAHGAGERASGGTASGVTVDGAGNVYGTTTGDNGAGTIFRLVKPKGHFGRWPYQVLYSFKGMRDGGFPYGGVTFDANGVLYGTTNQGGNSGCYGSGCGTVFSLTPTQSGSWTHAILYTFVGTGDGGLPQANLLFGPNGALYGSTPNGGVGPGCSSPGCGVAFRLTPPHTPGGSWTENALHTFRGNGDGYVPYGDVVFGKDGLLYGATEFGGKASCSGGFGCGTVFSVAP